LRGERYELSSPLDDRYDDKLPSLDDLHHAFCSSISSCQHQHAHNHSGDRHEYDQPGRHPDLVQHGLHNRDANLLHHDLPGLILDVHERVLHLLVSGNPLDDRDEHLLQHRRAHDLRSCHCHKPVPRRTSLRVCFRSANDYSVDILFASDRREPDELGRTIIAR